MMSRAERLRQNAANSSFTMSKNKSYKKHPKKQYKNKKSKDDMDKFIEHIKTLKNLDEFTVKKITKNDGTADFIAEYFTIPENNNVINTNQLRDIYNSLKKIDQLNKDWSEIKLYYNLFLLDIQLKHEKNVIPKKFYELMNSFTDIVNNIKIENEKVHNIDKIILLMESVVGYQKYYKLSNKTTNQFIKKMISKIKREYLSNLDKNDKYVDDLVELVSNLNNEDVDKIKIYQLRKIFNELRYMERHSNDWLNLEDKFYEFYPKLAYISGRNLIPLSYYKLLTHCMNIIDKSDNEEKMILFKNFILYLESLISLTTYESKKNSFKVNNNV